jgi:hypothetical protein
VIKLENIISLADLSTEEQFNEIESELKEECTKYGPILSIQIPRPNFFTTP